MSSPGREAHACCGRRYSVIFTAFTREVTAVSEENEVLKTENAELQTNVEQRLQQGDSSSRGPLLSR